MRARDVGDPRLCAYEAPGRLGTGQGLGNVSAGEGFKSIAGVDGLEDWMNSGWVGPIWIGLE